MTHAACQDKSGGSSPEAKGKGPSLVPETLYIHIHHKRERCLYPTHTRAISPLFSIWLDFGVIWIEANACFLHTLLHERLADVGSLHSSPAPTMSSCSKFSSGPWDLTSAGTDHCSFCFKQRVLVRGSPFCRKLYSGEVDRKRFLWQGLPRVS